MPQHQLHFTAQVDAPLAAVFELFADHRRFSWLFGMPCRVVATGRDEPHGVGSVRRLLAGPLSFDETVIAFERDRAIDYRISRGGPLKNHLGQIRFRDDGKRTLVDYRIGFDARIPGTGALLARTLSLGWHRNSGRVLRALPPR